MTNLQVNIGIWARTLSPILQHLKNTWTLQITRDSWCEAPQTTDVSAVGELVPITWGCAKGRGLKITWNNALTGSGAILLTVKLIIHVTWWGISMHNIHQPSWTIYSGPFRSHTTHKIHTNLIHVSWISRPTLAITNLPPFGKTRNPQQKLHLKKHLQFQLLPETICPPSCALWPAISQGKWRAWHRGIMVFSIFQRRYLLNVNKKQVIKNIYSIPR